MLLCYVVSDVLFSDIVLGIVQCECKEGGRKQVGGISVYWYQTLRITAVVVKYC